MTDTRDEQKQKLWAYLDSKLAESISRFYEDDEDDDKDEMEALKIALRNPVFESLNDPCEDIYTLEDGEPFVDEGY